MSRPAYGLRSTLVCLVAIGAWSIASPAQQPGQSGGSVVYVEPVQSLHRPIYDKLKAERWLERIQSVIQLFKTPKPVGLRLDNCNGEVEAWFEHDAITVCYEYLHVVARQIEARSLPPWVGSGEALGGAFVDAVLHELGHALFRYHRIPILGREEDAADQLSVFLILYLGGDDATGLIRGVANVYLTWMLFARDRASGDALAALRHREARAHPTPAQRLYNLVCLALGSDPDDFAALAKAIDLSKQRVEDCPAEYAQVEAAFRKLVRPHVDETREAEAKRQFLYFTTLK